VGEQKAGWEFWVGFPRWRWHRLSAENKVFSPVQELLRPDWSIFLYSPNSI